MNKKNSKYKGVNSSIKLKKMLNKKSNIESTH